MPIEPSLKEVVAGYGVLVQRLREENEVLQALALKAQEAIDNLETELQRLRKIYD